MEDLSCEGEGERMVRERVLAEVARPFDLERGPVLRARLWRLGAADHVLCVVVHHVVADGWSMGVLTGELSEVYAALVAGREPQLEELPVQYGDFAVWQREWLAGEELDRQLSFWEERFGWGSGVGVAD